MSKKLKRVTEKLHKSESIVIGLKEYIKDLVSDNQALRKRSKKAYNTLDEYRTQNIEMRDELVKLMQSQSMEVRRVFFHKFGITTNGWN